MRLHPERVRTARRFRITHNPNKDKDAAFVRALREAGHDFVDGPGDVTLTDVEIPLDAHGRLLELNRRAIVYPHAPGAVHFTDGRWWPHPNVIANFVIGEGTAETMRAFGYPHELIPVGWPYGGLAPFRPTAARRVLFAPTHPRDYGYASRRNRLANRRAFEMLRGLGVDLTVRMIGTPRQNGIYRVDGVDFHRVGYDRNRPADAARPLEEDLAAADVVVATGTVIYRSVAAGKPTVGYGQLLWPEDWVHPEQPLRTRSFPRFAPRAKFPVDLFAGDPASVIRDACRSDDAVADWRRRFIGEPFDAEHFVSEFERVLSAAA